MMLARAFQTLEWIERGKQRAQIGMLDQQRQLVGRTLQVPRAALTAAAGRFQVSPSHIEVAQAYRAVKDARQERVPVSRKRCGALWLNLSRGSLARPGPALGKRDFTEAQRGELAPERLQHHACGT